MDEEKSLPPMIVLWHRIENGALALALGVMIVLAFTQIVLRNVVDTGLYWADGLLRYLVLWIGLLGAMIATRERNHISVDIVSYALKGRSKSIVKVLTDGFSSAVCVALTVGAVTFVLNERVENLMAFGRVPAWAAELILPLSFLVMSLRFLSHFRQDFIEAARGQSNPTPDSE
jgi:TRAP-type C4-dicarboxylate transport system permease small subunit